MIYTEIKIFSIALKSIKLNIHLLILCFSNSAPREMSAYVHQKICSSLIIVKD